MSAILAVEMRTDADVVLARQRTRDVAALLGFDAQEQTRVATAASEIARNAFRYARGGRVELSVDGVLDEEPAGAARARARQHLVVRVVDRGDGIPHLDAVLSGRYVSTTGLGLGIVGARRLADHFDIETRPGVGTTVTLAQTLPAQAPFVTRAAVTRLTAELARRAPANPAAELELQNQELLRTLDALRARHAEVERLNTELHETNRGVLALYAELDDSAQQLRRSSEQKSRFLSNVSHELRAPLTSIMNISRLMVEHASAGLSDEHRRQIGFIRTSAQSLSDIVNDLLDLAKIEAGRADVRPVRVDVANLFGALRGMFRPLLPSDDVALTFDEPPPFELVTDEGKLAQILRNFVSNALKYTERGEVRVSAARLDDDLVAFTVRDTGVGIAAEHHDAIFDEFVQVEGPHQRRVKGTGLGLPLSRKLAGLLGGTVTVDSAPGAGSTFTLTVPRLHLAAPANDASYDVRLVTSRGAA